jgi:hypothetical protein
VKLWQVFTIVKNKNRRKIMSTMKNIKRKRGRKVEEWKRR